MRWLEIALFLLPFAAYGVWLWRGRRHGMQLAWATAVLALVSVILVAWLELSRSVPPEMIYVPPRMEGDRIVPAHAVRRPPP